MNAMVMEQRTALSGRRAIEVPGRLHVGVAQDCARFTLRIGTDGREAAGQALGLPLPAKIGAMTTAGGRAVLGLGPDEWSILAPAAEADAIARALSGLTIPHSLVETSHRDLGIAVTGPAAERALSAACALDLSVMPDGSVTRTLFDKATIVLIRHDATHYRIEVWQSFATHVWGLLDAVSREIALDL